FHVTGVQTCALPISAAAGDDDLADMAQAAWVGKARAHLFRGEYVEAITAAGNVDDDFEFIVPKIDDPSFRGRLGNTVWNFTLARSEARRVGRGCRYG